MFQLIDINERPKPPPFLQQEVFLKLTLALKENSIQKIVSGADPFLMVIVQTVKANCLFSENSPSCAICIRVEYPFFFPPNPDVPS